MHDRPAIRVLHGDGESIRGIARHQAASRNAVRRALKPGARDHYYRPSASSSAEPAVRDVLADYPDMSVSDIAVLIDWRHARRTLSDLVAKLRPEYGGGTSDVYARPMSSLTAGTVAAGEISFGTMQLGRVSL
ncbi:helix-turn-helix DNA-binding domain protein [Arthrobacter phage Popper]|uniref:Helix-turn-helix DNA binding domain protein n=1 Tax=Arthrobacter phage Popper TaxID=2859633 RepID=A0AAE7WFZ7_9CAUD|nr:helix-turn-helix DNA-binding domain protein [Arthrobacter phage Popper]QYC54921.1 helix-turn-helix DNA-binding domain protein [Arthrobacter phage Popper]